MIHSIRAAELDAIDDVIRHLKATTPLTFEWAMIIATRCIAAYVTDTLRRPDEVLRLWDRTAHPGLRIDAEDTLWDAVRESTRQQLMEDWELAPVEAIDLWLTEALQLVGVERDDATDIHEALALLRQASR